MIQNTRLVAANSAVKSASSLNSSDEFWSKDSNPLASFNIEDNDIPSNSDVL